MNNVVAHQQQEAEQPSLHPAVNAFVGDISSICRERDTLRLENAMLQNRVDVAEGISAELKVLLTSVTSERDKYMRVVLTMTTRMDDARGLLDKMYADMKGAAAVPVTETSSEIPNGS